MKHSVYKFVVAFALLFSVSVFSGREARAQVITMGPTEIIQNVLQTLQDADLAGWFEDVSSILKDKEEYAEIIEKLKGVTVAIAYIKLLSTTANVAFHVYDDLAEYEQMLKWFNETGQWYQIVSARAVYYSYKDAIKNIMEFYKQRTSMFQTQSVHLQTNSITGLAPGSSFTNPISGQQEGGSGGFKTSALGRENAIQAIQYVEDLIAQTYAYLAEAKMRADYSFYVLYSDVVRLENIAANAKLADIVYF